MADESSHAGDETRLCHTELHQHFSGYLNGASSSSYASSSPFFETICGSLYRKKLEKGQVQYREVLAEDKRLQLIQAFHVKTPGAPHHTLEDTYRLVAEHYWWEGMYFQVRDFVLSCDECQLMWNKKVDCSEVRNVSKMVKSHSHKVLSKLNSQRETGLFCDITLKTGNGHSFVAHKAVLAAVSEYFQELFTEMDSAAEPQPHVDLTDVNLAIWDGGVYGTDTFLNRRVSRRASGVKLCRCGDALLKQPKGVCALRSFSEESLLALLEFSYTSTLTLNLGTLMEVAAMARHLRMWPALEACSALQSEQEAGLQSAKLSTPVEASSAMSGSSFMNSFSLDRTVGSKRKREKGRFGVSLQNRAHMVEGTDESDQEGWSAQTGPTQCQSQVLFSPQAEDNGFPCSPTRRMKLMDFKSPSSKRKLSPRPSSSVISSSPSTATRSSSPSRRLLRSSPGAALALRRLLPKIDLATKRKRKSSSFHRPYRVKSDNSATQVTPVKVKQEAEVEDMCCIVPQDEVHSPRAQEKYRLLSFLGLQRRSLVPGPEERAGWGQKKRLRKLKVSDYSLTVRRKPRTQSQGSYATNLGGFVGVSSSLSLCDMTRMDLLNKVIKVEPQVGLDKRSKRKLDTIGQIEQLSVRTTRSQSLHAGSFNDRPLRSHSRRSGNPLPQPAGRERVTVREAHALPKKTSFKTKEEPTEYIISQPAPSGTRRRQVPPVASSKARVSAPKVGPPVSRPSAITTTESKSKVHYNMESTTTDKHKLIRQNQSVREKSKQGQNSLKVRIQPEQSCMAKVKKNKKNMSHEKKIEENATDVQGTRGWNLSNTNHEHYNNPLYKAIKEEPADPLPLTQSFLTSDVSDLGKRQSKPPVKLLDQGFLFGLCRPPGGIKREEESVDICLTRSVSHSSTSHSNMSPAAVRRDRIQARLSSDGSGLNGPHWAGLGNRSTSSSRGLFLRVKKEEEKTSISHHSKAIRSTSQLSVGKKSCKVKKEPPKTKKLHPVSSRRTVMMESIRQACVNQPKPTRGQASSGVHSCLQCRASYRDCDSLIMHRIRHIEGKHWPCPLCSKTFFREINVRNHIKTHNPKLYKCRQCIAAS